MGRLIGTTEVARRLSVCRDTVYAMARDGRLLPVRLTPGKLLFDEEQVEEALRQASAPVPPATELTTADANATVPA
jgi:excisionase family DNA binding protein